MDVQVAAQQLFPVQRFVGGNFLSSSSLSRRSTPHQESLHRYGPARSPPQEVGGLAGGEAVSHQEPSQFLLVEGQVAGVQDGHAALKDGVQEDVRGLVPAQEADGEAGGEAFSEQGQRPQYRPVPQVVEVVQDQDVLFFVGEEQVQGVEQGLQEGGAHPLRGPGQPSVRPLGEGEAPKELADETALVVVVGVQRDPGVLVALRGQPLRDGEALSEPAGSPDVDPVSSALLRGV